MVKPTHERGQPISGLAYLLQMVTADQVDVEALEAEQESNPLFHELNEMDRASFIKRLALHCLSSWADPATLVRYSRIVNFFLEEISNPKIRAEAKGTWDTAIERLGEQIDAVKEELEKTKGRLRAALEEEAIWLDLDTTLFPFPAGESLTEMFALNRPHVTQYLPSKNFLQALVDKIGGEPLTAAEFIKIWEDLAAQTGLQAPHFDYFITRIFKNNMAKRISAMRKRAFKKYNKKLKADGLFQN